MFVVLIFSPEIRAPPLRLNADLYSTVHFEMSRQYRLFSFSVRNATRYFLHTHKMRFYLPGSMDGILFEHVFE
jgi:hypothetical protein